MCRYNFYVCNIDYRSRATNIGINSLVKILKENEHPDYENKMNILQDEEKNYLKFSKPIFLNASK